MSTPPQPGDATPGPESRRVPFMELLGVRVAELGRGRSRVELTVRHEHLRTLGIAHGGVTATLLDTALGVACGTAAPPDHYVVTAQLNVNFIRPIWDGEAVAAVGEVIHAGRQTAVARGEIRTAAGVLAASASGTFIFLRHTDQTRTRIERVDDAILNSPG